MDGDIQHEPNTFPNEVLTKSLCCILISVLCGIVSLVTFFVVIIISVTDGTEHTSYNLWVLIVSACIMLVFSILSGLIWDYCNHPQRYDRLTRCFQSCNVWFVDFCGRGCRKREYIYINDDYSF